MFEVRSAGPLVRLVMARQLLGRRLHKVSAYVSGPLLIDAGPPTMAGELVRWLREDPRGRRVRAVLITHHHEDHVGGCARIARELSLPIYAPPATVERMAGGHRIPFYRWLIWGSVPSTDAGQSLGEVFEGEGRSLRVIPTPGHAFDHVCYFDEDAGTLFSGDLFVHERVHSARRIEDPWEHLASLKRVRDLAPRRMACAHAGWVEEPVSALDRKIAYWQQLAERARDLAAEGESVAAIRRRLLGREGVLTLFSLGDFSKKRLIAKLLAGP
ncbi:MAG: MBL fold metallo-hydrolase [Acidobacteriota bacterium]